MRWYDYSPRPNETRVRTRFLWMPKTIDGQTRWLELAAWQERYSGVVSGVVSRVPVWDAVRWVSP